jgi:malate dehydrogenase (oxaloacetate-decarboxylating)(NADP+)
MLVGRRGTPPISAERRVGNRPSVAAAMMLHAGLADAAICGATGAWWRQIQYILPIIPRRPDVSRVYGLSCVVLPNGTLFLCDTHMVLDPTAAQIAEMTLLAADAVRGFGITPKAALVSHSNFGASDTDSARKMRRALAMIRERAPTLEIDGEMHADAALVQSIRDAAVPDSKLTGTANLLIMPDLDSANIGFNLVKAAADGLPIGPMLLGMTKPIHVVVPSVTARGIVNLSALAVMQARSDARTP